MFVVTRSRGGLCSLAPALLYGTCWAHGILMANHQKTSYFACALRCETRSGTKRANREGAQSPKRTSPHVAPGGAPTPAPAPAVRGRLRCGTCWAHGILMASHEKTSYFVWCAGTIYGAVAHTLRAASRGLPLAAAAPRWPQRCCAEHVGRTEY